MIDYTNCLCQRSSTLKNSKTTKIVRSSYDPISCVYLKATGRKKKKEENGKRDEQKKLWHRPYASVE
jgi:hypothetical protein